MCIQGMAPKVLTLIHSNDQLLAVIMARSKERDHSHRIVSNNWTESNYFSNTYLLYWYIGVDVYVWSHDLININRSINVIKHLISSNVHNLAYMLCLCLLMMQFLTNYINIQIYMLHYLINGLNDVCLCICVPSNEFILTFNILAIISF